jgi:hypothetical protein
MKKHSRMAPEWPLTIGLLVISLFTVRLRGASAPFPAPPHFFVGRIGVVSGSYIGFPAVNAQDSRLGAPSLFRTSGRLSREA